MVGGTEGARCARRWRALFVVLLALASAVVVIAFMAFLLEAQHGR
jgi:uncharacterized protein YpmS